MLRADDDHRSRAARDPDAHQTNRSTDPHWTLGLSLFERADMLARKAPDVSVTAAAAAPPDDDPAADFRTHCAAVFRYVREHADAQAVRLARDLLTERRAGSLPRGSRPAPRRRPRRQGLARRVT